MMYCTNLLCTVLSLQYALHLINRPIERPSYDSSKIYCATSISVTMTTYVDDMMSSRVVLTIYDIEQRESFHILNQDQLRFRLSHKRSQNSPVWIYRASQLHSYGS